MAEEEELVGHLCRSLWLAAWCFLFLEITMQYDFFVFNIVSEMILAAGEEGLKRTIEMLNSIYETCIIPEDLGKSLIIPIPKKQNATECEAFRTISLISHF